MIQALRSGTLDVYVAGLAPLLVARSKGIDVRVVAATVVEEMGFAASATLAPFLEGQHRGRRPSRRSAKRTAARPSLPPSRSAPVPTPR